MVSEDSLSLGQEQRVSSRGLYIEVSGWSTAVVVDRDTKTTGVGDSVSVRVRGERLGRVKLNPLVYELGSVPGRKRFHSQHGGATVQTTEACREMGSVGRGRGWPGLIEQ